MFTAIVATVAQGFEFGEAALPRQKRQAVGRSNVQVQMA